MDEGASGTLMKCIVLTAECGHDWRRITDLPYIDNLSGIKLSYTDDGQFDGYSYI